MQCDCQVHLRPTLSPPNLEEYLKTVQQVQVPSQLNKYRVYLRVARSLDYNISDQVTKVSSCSQRLLTGCSVFCSRNQFSYVASKLHGSQIRLCLNKNNCLLHHLLVPTQMSHFIKLSVF